MAPFPCPACGARLTVPDEQAGERVLCPSCQSPVLAPDPFTVDFGAAPPDLGGRPAPRPGEPEKPLQTGPSASGRFARPGQAVEAADVAAALSARMRRPEADPVVREVTAAWLALTAVAVTLFVVGLVADPRAFPVVAGVGKVQLVVALVLFARETAAAKLSRSLGLGGVRPAWFALTGLPLVGLGLAGVPIRAAVLPVLASLTAPDAPPADDRYAGPVGQLRLERDRRQPDALIARLAEFADPAAANSPASATPEARAALAAELRDILKDDDRPPVRAAALAALVAWDPDGSRGAVLAALAAADPAERKAGMAVADRYPDAAVAAAVAARFPEREERVAAKEALERIGGPVAEAAAVPLLRSENHFTVLDVCEVLEQVGGPAAVAALTDLTRTSDDLLIRTAARQTADAITARLAAKR